MTFKGLTGETADAEGTPSGAILLEDDRDATILGATATYDPFRRDESRREQESHHASTFGQSGSGNDAADPAAAIAAPIAAMVPNDPYAKSQWHVGNSLGPDIDAREVWDDYTGRGVTVGVIDDGIDYRHQDLDGNYNAALDYDARDRDGDAMTSDRTDSHGTLVAGVIGAEMNNGYGGVGVAPGADLVGFRMGYGANGSGSQLADNLARQVTVDVSNNSWAYDALFFDDFNGPFKAMGESLARGAAEGRDGLGTIFVFSAGNYRGSGDNTNYHNFQNSQYGITVGAITQNGAIAGYSNPGASVLVAAPGSGIYTTDRPGTDGQASGDFKSVSGTSFSAPVVSGVVALMLEANPELGYRDVQEILAYSATRAGTSEAPWRINGARDWNGGGLHISDDYGFGVVDAHAAVRLAETWNAQSTKANLDLATASSNRFATIPDGGTLTDSVTIANGNLKIDRVDVVLNIDHDAIGQLIVTLTSPNGTTSTLVNRPGGGSSGLDDIRFTVDSVQFWGETGTGTWTLTVQDRTTGTVGRLESWTLKLYGDTDSANDSYIFTDEFGKFTSLADLARRTLTDTDGGIDQINLAAVKSDIVLNLNPGALSTVAGNNLTIAAGTVIENACLGDGDDRFTGNAANNRVLGGRGDDILDGGAGTDTAIYWGALSNFSVFRGADDFVVVDCRPGAGIIDEGTDLLRGFESLVFGGISYSLSSLLGTPSNTPPTAIDDAATTKEDQAVTVAVLANDLNPDNDQLSVSVLSNPSHGSVTINADGTVSYRPDANFDGTDSFEYTVSDGKGGSDAGRVSISVIGVNDAPVAKADAATTTAGAPVVIRALDNDTDIEGSPLQASIFSQPATGHVTLNGDGTFTYVPEAGFTGTTSFIYRVSDGTAWSGTAAVTVTVLPANAMPVANGDSVSTNEDEAVRFYPLVNDSDADGDSLSAKILTQAQRGTVTLDAAGAFLYTPTANYNGEDSFTYQVTDGHGGSASATVKIKVAAVNDTPEAVNDTGAAISAAQLGGSQAIRVDVLANDRDADGDLLTTSLRTGAANGTVTHNSDGSFVYTPTSGFVGTDNFTYFVKDGSGAQDWAQVSISVAPLQTTSKVIMGTAGNNSLRGLAPAESIYGLEGNDSISGGGGNDLIDGGAGNDRLLGDGGDDVLTGGLGIDQLTGGTGRDRFDFNDIAERGDRINSFERGKDVLDARDLFADVTSDGVDVMGMIENFVHQRYDVASKSIIVSVDVDGAGGPAGFVDLASISGVGSAPLNVGTDIVVE